MLIQQSGYSQLSLWKRINTTPGLLPTLAATALVNPLLLPSFTAAALFAATFNGLKNKGVVDTSREVPVLAPPHTSTHSLKKLWYPSMFL